MMNKSFGIALSIALGLHILVMAAVGIKSYEAPGRSRPYTTIDFLGPILGKTAFDMMLGHNSSRDNIIYSGDLVDRRKLVVTVPEKALGARAFSPDREKNMDASILGSLAGEKAAPDMETRASSWAAKEERGVMYKPEAPLIMKEPYGDKTSFRIRIKALVDREGRVLKTEPVTTTGYPQLDMAAGKFVEKWIYEPAKGGTSNDEWHEEDVVLKAGNER